jgi:hypothetical protein
MAERSSAIFWVLNCPIYLLRCYINCFCLSQQALFKPPSPQFWGALKKIYFLVPPELGARERLIADLARLYDLCIHGSSTHFGKKKTVSVRISLY